MKLYDNVISSWQNLLDEFAGEGEAKKNLQKKILSLESNWTDSGKKNMVLRSEMAYELGGSENQFYALGGTAVTSNEIFVPEDQILLYGKDLAEITEEGSYARISICRVQEDSMGEGESLYKAIKNLEYVRYHVNPEGFMSRVSSLQGRESVRVSKEAIKKGISFSDVGSLMIKNFHKDPKVIAAKVIFITASDFPYAALENEIKKADDITKAIDHIMSSSLMDCGTCGLQKICDEVEGMRELHFEKTQ
mgnify:CR=1 FL=1